MTVRSLYEQLFPLSIVMKQRVVDNFDGDTLNERWFERNVAGVCEYEMQDLVDGGARIVVGSAEEGHLDFNGIRHYSNTGSVVISVFNFSLQTLMDGGAGLKQNNTLDNDFAWMGYFRTTETDWTISTADASTTSRTASNIADIASPTLHKLELTSSNALYTISGNLEVTKESNRPTAALQPLYFGDAGATGNRHAIIRYYEVYNT